jgi:hypothetical protein
LRDEARVGTQPGEPVIEKPVFSGTLGVPRSTRLFDHQEPRTFVFAAHQKH